MVTSAAINIKTVCNLETGNFTIKAENSLDGNNQVLPTIFAATMLEYDALIDNVLVKEGELALSYNRDGMNPGSITENGELVISVPDDDDINLYTKPQNDLLYG